MIEAVFTSVGEVMSREVERIDSMETVGLAIARMNARGISSLVVDQRDERDEFGLLLVSDIARQVAIADQPWARVNVYEMMIKPAPCLNSEMNIKYAIRHMAKYNLTHSIVLEGRNLVGIVTLRDMALRFVDDSARQKR